MPTEHSFTDIYSFTLLHVSFLLCIVELRLSALIWVCLYEDKWTANRSLWSRTPKAEEEGFKEVQGHCGIRTLSAVRLRWPSCCRCCCCCCRCSCSSICCSCCFLSLLHSSSLVLSLALPKLVSSRRVAMVTSVIGVCRPIGKTSRCAVCCSLST